MPEHVPPDDAFARGAHFRWFDSGDLQSVEHLEKILWVARRTSNVGHWISTHEPHIVGKRASAIPENLALRISADAIGKLPTTPTWDLPTSTAHRQPGDPIRSSSGRRGDSIECRAYLRGHHCGPCRACWSPKVRNVSYLLNAGLRSITHDTARFRLTVLP